jgi:hypothetical protein
MPRSTDLLGRDALIDQVRESVAAGRSVLLFGPEGIGKSAVIGAVARDGLVIVDPFEHITIQQACRMRRALDRGAVYLGAARVARGRALGAVGRIMWRFSTVRVRELPDPIIQRIVTREVRGRGEADAKPETAWLHEVATLARGRPGFATDMARFAAGWKRQRGYLPMPALAFAATRQDATIRTLRPLERVAGRSTGASKVQP